jgi:hypothetical protein
MRAFAGVFVFLPDDFIEKWFRHKHPVLSSAKRIGSKRASLKGFAGQGCRRRLIEHMFDAELDP